MEIYVGNMAKEVTDEDLKQAFGAFGKVEKVNIVKHKTTGEPKGFGFVSMPENAEAQAAIAGLNEKDLKGKNIKVNEARSKTPPAPTVTPGTK